MSERGKACAQLSGRSQPSPASIFGDPETTATSIVQSVRENADTKGLRASVPARTDGQTPAQGTGAALYLTHSSS
jgi:hypothetical protein